MSFVFTNSDDRITIQSVNTTGQIDHIPEGVYTISMHPMTGDKYMIKNRKKFDLPAKIYGETNAYRDVIIDDFFSSDAPMGVILTGLKGSGKTMLAESIGNHFISKGYPVLTIDSSFTADFIRTMVALAQYGNAGHTGKPMPVMVLFDEFGKQYLTKESRDSLLTLFSDSSLKDVLFVVTSNDGKAELSEFMVNRPGRFKYMIEYGDISQETATELFDDMGVDQKFREILGHYLRAHTVSFDILRFLGKEALKCTSATQLATRIKILNVPAMVYPSYHVMETFYKGEKYYGEAVFELDESVMTLKLLDDESNIIEQEIFTWAELADKQFLSGTENSLDAKVKASVSADIKIVLLRDVAKSVATCSYRRAFKPLPAPVDDEGNDIPDDKLEIKGVELKGSKGVTAEVIKDGDKFVMGNSMQTAAGTQLPEEFTFGTYVPQVGENEQFLGRLNGPHHLPGTPGDNPKQF